MRIAIVYDCLFPWTVGGAERWYRGLAERLAAAGHAITYLTLTQWEAGEEPQVPGVEVVAVGPRMALYGGDGNRRAAPPLRFGAGVLAHLWRHGGRYDVVHTASFPYFSLLAAGLARRRHSFRITSDWFEVWSRDYWRAYLGPTGGEVGWAVQAACARVPQRAFCFSRLHGERLRSLGLRGPVRLLSGMYGGAGAPRSPTSAAPSGPTPAPATPHFVFAGRHIPEKQVPALVPALAEARERLPDLRATILGDGPEREQVLRAVAEHGLADVVAVPGFVSTAEVEAAMDAATAIVLPSRREGYGLVVVEAAARGIPAVVVAGADNAAVELVDEDENGVVAGSVEPAVLASALLRAHEGGDALRRRTAAWYARNAERLSLDGSLRTVLAGYGA